MLLSCSQDSQRHFSRGLQELYWRLQIFLLPGIISVAVLPGLSLAHASLNSWRSNLSSHCSYSDGIISNGWLDLPPWFLHTSGRHVSISSKNVIQGLHVIVFNGIWKLNNLKGKSRELITLIGTNGRLSMMLRVSPLWTTVFNNEDNFTF